MIRTITSHSAESGKRACFGHSAQQPPTEPRLPEASRNHSAGPRAAADRLGLRRRKKEQEEHHHHRTSMTLSGPERLTSCLQIQDELRTHELPLSARRQLCIHKHDDIQTRTRRRTQKSAGAGSDDFLVSLPRYPHASPDHGNAAASETYPSGTSAGPANVSGRPGNETEKEREME